MDETIEGGWTNPSRRPLKDRIFLFVAENFRLIAFYIAAVGLVITYLLSRKGLESEFLTFAVVASLVGSIAMGMLRYLEPSRGRTSASARAGNGHITEYIDAAVERALAAGIAPPNALAEEDRERLLHQLSSRLEAQATALFLPVLAEQLEKRYKTHSVDAAFSKMIGRLERETIDLAKRGNLNLILGAISTIFGLCILGYSVSAAPPTNDYSLLLSYFLPRLSLVLVVEIFAFFFLRLYKESLMGIKYFQNELTNVESKRIALVSATDSGQAELYSHVVQAISSTERNIILNKDQTTIELERDKIERDTAIGLVEQLKALVKGSGSKEG